MTAQRPPVAGETVPGVGTSEQSVTVLLYSDDRSVRDAVKMAVGRRAASDLPLVRWRECATQPAVLAAMDAGGIDLAILDGEASPSGGLGLARQLKDEIFHCPPCLVLIGRPQDSWLATWSRAEGVVAHPLDPVAVSTVVATLLRQRVETAASTT